jgi:hypothetical protein
MTTPEPRALVEHIFARYESRAAPRVQALRAAEDKRARPKARPSAFDAEEN